jgi:hypothetical protein
MGTGGGKIECQTDAGDRAVRASARTGILRR